MDFDGRSVAIFLNRKGRRALELAHGFSKDPPIITFYVFEADHIGIWVSDRREDGEHKLLIRWDCILALDVAEGGAPAIRETVN